MAKLKLESQNNIAETLLMALYLRAVESQSPHPIYVDPEASHLVEQIDYDFSRFKISPLDRATLAMRVREFDHYTCEFLLRYPASVVVNIGCGLDTRFSRLDNGLVEWYDLDLPEVMDIRNKLISEEGRCHMLGLSIFDPQWLELVKKYPHKPTLFLAEGVFPYFTEQQVKDLFQLFKENFPGCELVCDAMSPTMIRMHNLQFIISKMGARLQWGLKNGHQPETWGSGIKLLSEWFYFDRPEPRLGSSQLMRYIPFLAKGVGIYHYQLGDPAT